MNFIELDFYLVTITYTLRGFSFEIIGYSSGFFIGYLVL